ncbi:UDP-N-acetylglucosamine 1-carboxyvinyltransferase [Candidatus Viridilinea mediisalina]|uniref:UDP-N-acetylglucosamine 1-carboxyvinyltransferase n=1 Tax=Candidatus Viridilinea mediisalina TaxID=2024553 RepID=A0A2A6RJP8_9CHLR|nr:UDP-N-acetylglucosamine 1-carboxyvinyltransferase [Candidatus Viridilinea mediisalina]PDW03088.1 UDP-N-acetylglucosamine 1-carboxyvinyltransferase [Candidatus Viridilinea mediisalina]
MISSLTTISAPPAPQGEARYRIRGGEPVVGQIRALGAKNFTTKALVAALLGTSPTCLTNVPPIGDVAITREMLVAIGVRVTAEGDALTIDPAALASAQVPIPDSGSNRIPILLLGALLHRFDEVAVPVLGGCRIGERPVDFHLNAIEQFGGIVSTTAEGYLARRRGRLRGTQIKLPYPSVGATETCLFLSVLAEGRSVIANAAIEPEIIDLITMLRAMGAVIFTSAGREIRVEGVPQLWGTRMPILGDRIEAASWACLAGASDGDITVTGINPNNLGNFLAYFQQVGGGFELLDNDSVRFFRRGPLQPTVVETDVYPGFSTDWQQPFAIMLTQANGISIIHETVYENRFGYLKALNALGANTQLTTHCLGGLPCRYRDANHEHSAIIVGPTPLYAEGHEITIPDLRAGLAYIIAAAIAHGTSFIRGVPMLERGYGDVVPRLARMNLKIERIWEA